jgi:hypothetical protein
VTTRRTERCSSRRNGVPGSEVSLGKIPLLRRSLRLEPRFLQLCPRQKLPLLRRSLRLEPGVLLLQLSQPPGLLGLHPAVLLPPTVIGRLRHLDDAADVGDGLALGDQLLGVLSLRMICSAVCLVRFMVESAAQSGRLRTLIQSGPVSGVHVN